MTHRNRNSYTQSINQFYFAIILFNINSFQALWLYKYPQRNCPGLGQDCWNRPAARSRSWLCPIMTAWKRQQWVTCSRYYHNSTSLMRIFFFYFIFAREIFSSIFFATERGVSRKYDSFEFYRFMKFENLLPHQHNMKFENFTVKAIE